MVTMITMIKGDWQYFHRLQLRLLINSYRSQIKKRVRLVLYKYRTIFLQIIRSCGIIFHSKLIYIPTENLDIHVILLTPINMNAKASKCDFESKICTEIPNRFTHTFVLVGCKAIVTSIGYIWIIFMHIVFFDPDITS